MFQNTGILLFYNQHIVIWSWLTQTLSTSKYQQKGIGRIWNRMGEEHTIIRGMENSKWLKVNNN